MRLNAKRTVFVGLAFFTICSFWQIYDSIIPLLLKQTFALNEAVAGGIMALDNVLALFMLPIFGALSDRTHTRIGKRMPYIVFGTLAAALLMIFLPIVASMKSLPLFMVALGLVLVVMGTYRSPAVALMPDVTPKPLRSQANAIINLMGAVGGILSLGFIAILSPKGGSFQYMPLFSVTALVMVLGVAVLSFVIREPRLALPDEKPAETASVNASLTSAERRSLLLILASVFLWFFGYNAVTTAFSKYATLYWKLEGGAFAYTLIIAQIAAILSYWPVSLFATRIGRRKTILLGITLLTFAFGAAYFFRVFTLWIFVFFAMAGVGWAAINVNSYPMVTELSRGANVGKYTGYYYTASMAAQIITPILSGALLQYVGYWTLFPYGACFVAASFATMACVRHGDSNPIKPACKLQSLAD
ncbi:MAG: MFS transporter [Clostridia bacterium]